MSEPFRRCCRQNRRAGNVAGMLTLLLVSIGIRPVCSAGGESSTLLMAQRMLLNGDLTGAAKQTRLALRSHAGDPALYLLGGTLLLNCGEWHKARADFENALATSPNDSLALYGLGLTQLGLGDRQDALRSFDHAERSGGDRSALLIARRYTQWLDGVQVDLEGAGLPDALVPAQHAIQGMMALRRRDPSKGASELQTALDALPITSGDIVREAVGPLMSFEPGRPLSAGVDTAGMQGLSPPPPKTHGLSGVLELTPREVGSDTVYVSYELDGHSIMLINSPPFTFSWNSTQAANGRHRMEIVFYDAQARELRRVKRDLYLVNPITGSDALPETSGQSGDGATGLRGTLWQALTLRPSRSACAVALSHVYRDRNDSAGARLWLMRAAAALPQDQTRRMLAECGGVNQPGSALWGGRPDEKVVALTFDDGPKPGVTEPLLDVLLRERVPATFFVIGRHVLEYPELTRKIAQAGMEIANHSFTHRNLTHISETEIAREVMQTQAAVTLTIGVAPRYLRPPGGNWNAKVAEIVRAWGLTPCMWTVDAYSAEVIGAQETADAVLRQVQPGSIVLMHNGKMSTVQALPTIIHELRRQGYAFATVAELARRLAVSRLEARRPDASLSGRAE